MLPSLVTRFGLPGPVSHQGNDRDALLAQLNQPVAIPQDEGLPSVDEGFRLFVTRRAEVAEAGRQGRPAQFLAPAEILEREAEARLALAIRTDAPLQERLALHWSNHFTVSGGILPGYLAGEMERSAIRAHMLGPFQALLRACTLHPAMLSYLSNTTSYGPNSTEGRRRRRGLNENLARELLELHSLGVDGGYTQEDVTETARILTGWTTNADRAQYEPPAILFRPERHEPGPRVVLGKRYPEGGAEQLDALLEDLARHPSTARHVARRLVRHFLGEAAPAEVGEALARTFLDTGGDLRAVIQALVLHPVSASLPARKLRPPTELVFGVGRMLGGLPSPPPLLRVLRALGQPWLSAPSPAGWPEEDNAWASPDSVKSRLDWALQLGARLQAGTDARQLAEAAFGRGLSEGTRRTIARAANAGQAFALLVMSPDVQRR